MCEIHAVKKLILKNRQEVCHWHVLRPALKNETPTMSLSAMIDMAPDLTFETSAAYFPKGHNEGLKGGFRDLSVKMKPSKADTSVCVTWIQLCLHSQRVARAQLFTSHVPQGFQRSQEVNKGQNKLRRHIAYK